jgi:hypothetical protein
MILFDCIALGRHDPGESQFESSLSTQVPFKGKHGKSEPHWCRSSVGCEHVQVLAGVERSKMLGESDTERNLHDT